MIMICKDEDVKIWRFSSATRIAITVRLQGRLVSTEQPGRLSSKDNRKKCLKGKRDKLKDENMVES